MGLIVEEAIHVRGKVVYGNCTFFLKFYCEPTTALNEEKKLVVAYNIFMANFILKVLSLKYEIIGICFCFFYFIHRFYFRYRYHRSPE